jgi:hypothetical protein
MKIIKGEIEVIRVKRPSLRQETDGTNKTIEFRIYSTTKLFFYKCRVEKIGVFNFKYWGLWVKSRCFSVKKLMFLIKRLMFWVKKLVFLVKKLAFSGKRGDFFWFNKVGVFVL